MASIVDLLRDLHRLHRQMRDVQAEIDRTPKAIAARRNLLAKHEADYKAAQDALKKLKASVAERESQLKSAHQLLQKYEKTLNEAGSTKEFEAAQAEITHTKARCETLETEILEGLTQIDEQTAALPNFEKQVAKTKTDLAAFEKEAAERAKVLAVDKTQTGQKVRELEKEIPEKIRPLYDRIISAYGADAMAEVINQTCTYCRTSIPTQTHHDLMSGQFITCRSCGRALYLVG